RTRSYSLRRTRRRTRSYSLRRTRSYSLRRTRSHSLRRTRSHSLIQGFPRVSRNRSHDTGLWRGSAVSVLTVQHKLLLGLF
uniref:Uncharacterized protein n=1 Tax=Neogobius melanostomus TaxID=47308 RepID=A0A8C6WP56_9GOBI